ncbi:AAA family ATPase [Streptomyces sp. M10(2022)]
MRLQRLSLPSYRGLQRFELDLTGALDGGHAIATLIGPNGGGKSRALHALAEIFGALHRPGHRAGFAFDLQYEVHDTTVRAVQTSPEAAPELTVTTSLGQPIRVARAVWTQHLPDHVFGYQAHAQAPWTSEFDQHRSAAARCISQWRRQWMNDFDEWRARHSPQDVELWTEQLTLPVNCPCTRPSSCARPRICRCCYLRRPPTGRIRSAPTCAATPTSSGWPPRSCGSGRHAPHAPAPGRPAVLGPGRACPHPVRGRRRVRPVRPHPRCRPGGRSRKPADGFQIVLGTSEDVRAFRNLFDSDLSMFGLLATLLDAGYLTVDVRLDKPGALTLGLNDLSSGEQQLLTILGLLRLQRAHESLFLLDEPDSHFHPEWSRRWYSSVRSVLGPHQNSQFLTATHEPLLVANMTREQIRVVTSDEEGQAAAVIPGPTRVGRRRRPADHRPVRSAHPTGRAHPRAG